MFPNAVDVWSLAYVRPGLAVGSMPIVTEAEIDAALTKCQRSYSRSERCDRDREAVRFNIALGKKLGIRG